MSEIKRKRNSYSLEKKLKIIKDVENKVEYNVILKTYEDEIIEIVKPLPKATNDSSDTEIDESQIEVISLDKSLKIPSSYEALNDVFELRLYLGSLEEVDNSYYDLLNKFENLILKNKKSLKQSLITDYFAKTN
jgi:hypothetical protein